MLHVGRQVVGWMLKSGGDGKHAEGGLLGWRNIGFLRGYPQNRS